MNDDNVFLKMDSMKESFTPVERRIADYIIENPEKIPTMAIKELAIKSRTSDASVLRFCRTLGFNGYRNFIVSMSIAKAASAEKDGNLYTDIKPGDGLSTIKENVFYNTIKAVDDTSKILDSEQLQKAVDMMCRAEQIRFFGTGASGLVCMDALQKFMRIRKVCYAHTDSHDQFTAATLMNRHDVAVLMTYSGETRDILEVFEILKKKNVPIIIITKYQKSELTEHASAILNISSPEITMRSGAMGSRIAMLCVVDILFSAVASATYKEVKKYLIDTHNVIAEHKRY